LLHAPGRLRPEPPAGGRGRAQDIHEPARLPVGGLTVRQSLDLGQRVTECPRQVLARLPERVLIADHLPIVRPRLPAGDPRTRTPPINGRMSKVDDRMSRTY